MGRRYFRNSALYLLFLLNCTRAVKDGVDAIFIVSAVLTGAVFVMDLMEVISYGRKK